MHPKDGRAMFAIPWEKRTIFGTTDLDHPFPLDQEPFCTNQEIDYMLEAIRAIFPEQISPTLPLSLLLPVFAPS